MPKNGYWIECIPVSSIADELSSSNAKNPRGLNRMLANHSSDNRSPDLYAASIEQFPDLDVTAPSPDQAIDALRARLKDVRDEYSKTGKILPELGNPVKPPQRLRKFQGWISVYIELVDGCCPSQAE